MHNEIVDNNKYLKTLKYLGIDTWELKHNIQNRIESSKDTFSLFSNRVYSLSSPNINLENIIFEESNKFIYKKYKDTFTFDVTLNQDLKSLIAVKNSLIERPSITRPSQIIEGIKENLDEVNEYVRIAKFENELVINGYGEDKKQYIVFEGLTPLKKETPFFQYLPSSLIWLDAFFYDQEEKLIGFCKKFDSIEAKYLLWLDSIELQHLGLTLDNHNNGLRALNHKNEVILKFRCWKEEPLENSSSHTNIDSNLSKLEGCELLLRRDYLDLLKVLVTDLEYVIKKINF